MLRTTVASGLRQRRRSDTGCRNRGGPRSRRGERSRQDLSRTSRCSGKPASAVPCEGAALPSCGKSATDLQAAGSIGPARSPAVGDPAGLRQGFHPTDLIKALGSMASPAARASASASEVGDDGFLGRSLDIGFSTDGRSTVQSPNPCPRATTGPPGSKSHWDARSNVGDFSEAVSAEEVAQAGGSGVELATCGLTRGRCARQRAAAEASRRCDRLGRSTSTRRRWCCHDVGQARSDGAQACPTWTASMLGT